VGFEPTTRVEAGEDGSCLRPPRPLWSLKSLVSVTNSERGCRIFSVVCLTALSLSRLLHGVMINTGKDMEGSGCNPTDTTYYPVVCLMELKKIMKTQFPGWHSNKAPFQYKSKLLWLHQPATSLVCVCSFKCLPVNRYESLFRMNHKLDYWKALWLWLSCLWSPI
jgi:hypothetical protein